MQSRLERTTTELKQAERALSLQKDELQLQLQKAQHNLTLANQQIQPLQLQVPPALLLPARNDLSAVASFQALCCLALPCPSYGLRSVWCVE